MSSKNLKASFSSKNENQSISSEKKVNKLETKLVDNNINSKREIKYNSPYISTKSSFVVELLNEINFIRDQPRHYRDDLNKFKKDKDEKNGTISVFLKEGKMTFNNKEFNSAIEVLDKSKVKKLLNIDGTLNKICEKIYNSRIRPLKNYNSLEVDVYKYIQSIISEFGTPAGKVSVIIDVDNNLPKPIVLYNVVGNQAFIYDKHQLIGIYQENKVTLCLLMRYFVPNSMQANIEYLSDSVIENEEENIEEIVYQDLENVEEGSIKCINEIGGNIVKLEKSTKISENNNKDLIKTIYIKKFFANGEEEEEVQQIKLNENKPISQNNSQNKSSSIDSATIANNIIINNMKKDIQNNPTPKSKKSSSKDLKSSKGEFTKSTKGSKPKEIKKPLKK